MKSVTLDILKFGLKRLILLLNEYPNGNPPIIK